MSLCSFWRRAGKRSLQIGCWWSKWWVFAKLSWMDCELIWWSDAQAPTMIASSSTALNQAGQNNVASGTCSLCWLRTWPLILYADSTILDATVVGEANTGVDATADALVDDEGSGRLTDKGISTTVNVRMIYSHLLKQRASVLRTLTRLIMSLKRRGAQSCDAMDFYLYPLLLFDISDLSFLFPCHVCLHGPL